MNDLTDLRAAFAELERRADAHADAHVDTHGRPEPAVHEAHAVLRPAAVATPLRPHRRAVLVGATAAALLAAVAGSVVLTTGSGEPTTASGSTSSDAASSVAASTDTGSTAPPVALTAADLAARFGSALDSLGTFTVTTSVDGRSAGGPTRTSAPSVGETGSTGTPDAAGPVSAGDSRDVLIAGVLTTAAGSGGYDVQTLVGVTGPASCASEFSCQVTTLPDGSSLAVGTTSVLAADGSPGGGTTYEVALVRPDGVDVILHVGNQSDPKGMSAVLSAAPPLTPAQMTAVVTSPYWVTR